eukprot:TRINITY_DN10182_c0_g1_i7.p1 TRINITY_DN10182_c0_g1~~TRINITY_DN10182_c0_g1_i7.p1  ORF type:complete len:120 (-),score=12.56 TRINITY_DN10182_c0_g1_i7:29-388(-)
MVDDFPITVAELVALLEIAAPHHRMVAKLKEFVEKALPPGFPVKLEMPVFPTVTATVTFTNFEREEVDESKFAIPSDYTRRPRQKRFRRKTEDKGKVGEVSSSSSSSSGSSGSISSPEE